MGLQDFQRRFAAALTPELPSDKAAAVSRTLFSGDENHRRAALAIYRNNVAHSLREALAEGFPVVKQLLGEDFFNDLAVRFLRENLPQRRALADYGRGFAEFLADLEEVSDLPWLADVARIEMAQREVFHAADDEAVAREDLKNLSDEDLAQSCFSLHAALIVLRMDWPADKIWRAHQDARVDEGLEIDRESICLVIRREGADVIVERVDQTLADFLEELDRGRSLGQAMSFMLAKCSDFDLASALGHCLSKNYFKQEKHHVSIG